MAKSAVYGIESFKMQNAVASGFPTSWDNAFEVKAIVKDSLTFNDSPASENDIEVEESTTIYASLPSSVATKGFTIQTYDMSEEAYKHLCGYEKASTNNTEGWVTETPSFQLPNQAVQIITKEFADFPSKTFQWANLQAKCTRTGTIGRSGFPNFNIEFKQQVVTDAQGKEIGGARWKENASSGT